MFFKCGLLRGWGAGCRGAGAWARRRDGDPAGSLEKTQMPKAPIGMETCR